ncbi:MAG TPA: hypothetical protein DCQ37_07930 [Desulfobacteraceae bacterium]|nr:hypothetical protein [Desulfobacteraceae bacterium]
MVNIESSSSIVFNIRKVFHNFAYRHRIHNVSPFHSTLSGFTGFYKDFQNNSIFKSVCFKQSPGNKLPVYYGMSRWDNM